MRDYVNFPEIEKNKQVNFDFKTIYEHTHKEMSLQQSKRDQMITLYLAIFSFSVPFVFSQTQFNFVIKALLFIVLGIIGILFALIVIRYRIYKESYWLSCETLTMLTNYRVEDINKKLIQSLFYASISKKYNKYIENGKIKKLVFVKNSIFSAETLHYIVIAFLVSVTISIAPCLLLWETNSILAIIACVCVLLIIFGYLLATYFCNLIKIFSTLKYQDAKTETEINIGDSKFNSVFSKAWTLHFYID